MRRTAIAASLLVVFTALAGCGKNESNVLEENKRTLDAMERISSTEIKQKEVIDGLEASLGARLDPGAVEPDAVRRFREVEALEAQRKEIDATQ